MTPSNLTYARLGRYVEGELTASQAEILNVALATSKESRERLERVQKAVAHLADTDGIADIDLLPNIRRRIDTSAPLSASKRRFSKRGIGLGLAAAAALLLAVPFGLFVFQDRATSTQEEIRSKSATGATESRARWIALNAFRLSKEEAPTRIRETLHPDDGLLFSYTNLGPAPFQRLMIFGIDETRQVYWYYPAFLDEKDNPMGIQIKSGVSREGLHEVIAHPYKEGELVLFGLFSDTAVSVSEIEQGVENGSSTAGDFEKRFDGARVKMLKVTVVK